MEYMENAPIPGPLREKAPQESGYSEEEQAQIVEGSTVDTKQVKKRVASLPVDRQAKILDAVRQTQATRVDLLKQLQESTINSRHQEKILEEIRSLHILEEELVQCLLLEQKGELSERTASQEAWNLIK